MLPSYIVTSRARTFHSQIGRPPNSVIDLLLTRSRLTNLGLVLLSSATTLSFLFNFYHYSPIQDPHRHNYTPQSQQFDYDPTQPISRDAWVSSLEHLIIVPGHAIWKGSDPQKKHLDSEWILEEYQKGGGRVQAFWDHIAAGAELALDDEKSLLVFSGGQTRASSATSTEAASYLRLAFASNLFPSVPHSRLFPRVTTEDYALDSYQNLLFSIARFHEFTGKYPTYITIIGYEIKRRRFEELHSKALRWPKERLEYIGIDGDKHEMEKAKQGELTNAYLPYKKDVYGCHTSLLSKRAKRNPFMRFHPYWTSAQELRGLFAWCPGDIADVTGGSWWSRIFGSSGVKSSKDEVTVKGELEEEGPWAAVFLGKLPWDSS